MQEFKDLLTAVLGDGLVRLDSVSGFEALPGAGFRLRVTFMGVGRLQQREWPARVDISRSFPFEPPVVRLLCRVRHPAWNRNGTLMCEPERFSNWRPGFKVSTRLLQVLVSQA